MKLSSLLSVISACANLGTLDKAKWVDFDASRDVFEKMPMRNVVSWSSMINAFSMYGEASDALMLFARMKQENVEPNEVTFVGGLYGCSHSGLLVEEGKND
ncbi:Pentatricopeptide repeat-containing protein [Cardamine amara subsp. amara]|uniref:Pentatricopeptide repeat-containing protein n=1 Tax=Cardamine amara subsp. amara TaxID=228776 RepID=A0ABD1C8W2_CARAN